MILGRVCRTTATIRDPETDAILLDPMTLVIITLALGDGGVGVILANGPAEPDYAYIVPLDALAFTDRCVPGYWLWPN